MADRAGFTLVEMLVAMAVFALAAMALLNLSGENTRSAARVEDRTLGGLIAENIAVESAILPQIADGPSDGRETLAGRDWRWTRLVTATEDPDLQRIDIRVSSNEGQAAQRIVFRHRVRS